MSRQASSLKLLLQTDITRDTRALKVSRDADGDESLVDRQIVIFIGVRVYEPEREVHGPVLRPFGFIEASHVRFGIGGAHVRSGQR